MISFMCWHGFIFNFQLDLLMLERKRPGSDKKKEYVISKQLLRSGTSIGANVHEAKNAQSRPDFNSKMNISLKEATETGYWLDLLADAEYISKKQYDSIIADCNHIVAVLIKIVKATKKQS